MEPRLLILETSGRVGRAALAEGGIVRVERPLNEARRHARDLAPTVADMLAGQGWRPKDVHGVIVSRGPGSYTGLRVGIMSAKAFAYATGCVVLGVETFLAVARQTADKVDVLDVIADAQQNKVYVQRFRRSSPQEPLQPAASLGIQTVAEWLAQPEQPTWASGPGLHGYRNHLPAAIRVPSADQWDPQPESLLQVALPRFRAGERDDLWNFEPLYLRPSAAEEQWRAQKHEPRRRREHRGKKTD